MDPVRLKALLTDVAAGAVSPDAAMARLRTMPFEDVGFAKLDHHRPLRSGLPETIYCAGKTAEQIITIVEHLSAQGVNVLGTRCNAEKAAKILAAHKDAVYHDTAHAFTLIMSSLDPLNGYVAVVCAGTSDMPVAEEGAVTCEAMGSKVERVFDVGVAGIHRLLAVREILANAVAVIVCAGMEGALPSAVGGLIDRPVIAVPTSVGYGASFGGIAALLGMLNSCASGISVVNIDNGYGAGILANRIHRIANGKS